MMGEGFLVAVGTVLGGAIAFLSAWAMRWLSRRRRTTNIAKLLWSEISTNGATLENAVSKVQEAQEKGEVKRYAGAPFSRTAFSNCVEGLAEFPRGTRDAVLKFYKRLDDVEWVVHESYFQEGRLPVDKVRPVTVTHLMAGLQEEFRQRTKRALESAEEALSELDRLTHD